MDLVSLKEKRKYDFLWENIPAYRTVSPGEMSAEYFLRYFGPKIQENDTIIDFGCGTGRASRLFLERGLDVTLVDFSPNCLDPEIKVLLALFPTRIRFIESCLAHFKTQGSWLYCCDVLEHIPESKIEEVLSSMASCNVKGGYMSISLAEDLFGMKALSEPLHVCIHDKNWWKEKISFHWDIVCEFISEENKTQLHCCVLKRLKQS